MVGSFCSALLLTGLLGAQASTAVVPPGDGPLPPRVAAVPTPDATTPPAEPPPVELPGGGRVVFPGRRLVALYGHPGAPSLGVLGEQGDRRLDRPGPSGGPDLPGPQHGPGRAVVRDHRHRRAALGRSRRRLLGRVHRPQPAAVGRRRRAQRHVRAARPAARPGGPARPGEALRAAAPPAARRSRRRPRVEARPPSEAARPDRQHRRRRDQPDLVLARHAGPPTRICRRSCSSCTSSGCR